MTPEQGKRLLSLKNSAVEHFKAENWMELGALTGTLDYVRGHGRLLRSLSFGDTDYGGAAFDVLTSMTNSNPDNFAEIEGYITSKFEAGGVSASSVEVPGKRIYFTPSAFQVPETGTETDLVSVMMPFGPSFSPVNAAIIEAAKRNNMRCLRADDIWIDSTVIQDIFSLIYRSQIVVCDFSNKNPNVFYEAGIAHTLGKHVIPITQHADDIPFDLKAHRYQQYLNNTEGLAKLTEDLSKRIETLAPRSGVASWLR